LAWQAERAEQCAGCGRQWSETTGEDTDEDYDAHLVVCNACAERSRKRRELAEHGGQVDGVYIAIRRRPDLE
jgi:predicted metal-binding protein